MKNIILLLICLLFISCTAGQITEHFPAQKDLKNPSQITIIRKSGFFGDGVRQKILLDGFVIAKMPVNTHFSIFVEEGTHSIGITDSTISLNFEENRNYFFVISVAWMATGLEIERIKKQEAEILIHKSRRLFE